VHVYVGSTLLHLCVGLIDFAVNFCLSYQCKWLPGGPSLKWPVMCRAAH